MTPEQYEATKAQLKQALAGLGVIAEQKQTADDKIQAVIEEIKAQHRELNQDTYARFEDATAKVAELESALKDHWSTEYLANPESKTSPDGILQVAISQKAVVKAEGKVLCWLESEAPMMIDRKPSKLFLDSVANGKIAIPPALLGHLEVKSKYTVRLLRKKL